MSNEAYFDAARDMFLTEGWQNFQKEVGAAIMNARIENLKDETEFWQTKGELAALHKIAGYQQMLLEAEKQSEEVEDESFE